MRPPADHPRGEDPAPAPAPPQPGPAPAQAQAQAPAGLFMIDVRLVSLQRYQTYIDHGRRGPRLPAAMITTVSPGRCAANRSRSRDPPRRRRGGAGERRGAVAAGAVADRVVAGWAGCRG